MSIKINCGLLIDGTGCDPIRNCSITIENGKIVNIDSNKCLNNQENVVDWGDYFVTPGIFDCHDHVSEDFVNKYDSEESRKIISSFLAAQNCSKILRSGITTVRETGAKYAVNIKLRNAIKNGIIEGPDIIAAGNRIARTGWPKWPVCREADGVDEIRKVVRDEYKNGADFIKLMITGVSDKGTTPTYSDQEIEAGITEAHRLGLKVGVHGYGGPAVSHAIKCGVDIVDHGTKLTDSDFEEMVQRGTYIVITLSILENFTDIDKLSPLNDSLLTEKNRKLYHELIDLIKKVQEYGILFSLGSDHHRDLAGYIRVLKDSGFSPVESLSIITRNGAILCDREDSKGTIEVGKNADIVAFEGDPENVGDYKRVKGVMKAGKMV